jgi:antitoxin component YwqK of YwqJK toxin-antitoxin module
MKWLIICIAMLCTAGCQKTPQEPIDGISFVEVKEALVRVNIVDQNAMSETISNQDRLKELAERNFLDPQPYKKVLRIYARDRQGTSKSLITSYYENGQIRQYLECINGRASGTYVEWHSNGQKKLVAHILAGIADLDEKAFASWSFNGPCTAWNEDGGIAATFVYDHGVLDGESRTFFPTGEVERIKIYEKGHLTGKETAFYKNGSTLEEITYHKSLRHGPMTVYFENGSVASQETYEQDLLIDGHYYTLSGEGLRSVEQKEGLRTVFDEGVLVSQHEIHEGRPEGWTTLFEKNGTISQRYQVKDGKKHGSEIQYYPGALQQKLSIEWKEGAIHGTVKTWYANGILESQREMCQNAKQGLSMAWYSDGSLMLVEEYDNDNLVRGRYHRRGETIAISQVEGGTGIASIFDDSGALIEKISYVDGKPQITEQ